MYVDWKEWRWPLSSTRTVSLSSDSSTGPFLAHTSHLYFTIESGLGPHLRMRTLGPTELKWLTCCHVVRLGMWLPIQRHSNTFENFYSLKLTLYPYTLAFWSWYFGGLGEGIYLNCDLSIGPNPGLASSFWTLPVGLWIQYDFLMGDLRLRECVSFPGSYRQ